jgi:hypothetical protein
MDSLSPVAETPGRDESDSLDSYNTADSRKKRKARKETKGRSSNNKKEKKQRKKRKSNALPDDMRKEKKHRKKRKFNALPDDVPLSYLLPKTSVAPTVAAEVSKPEDNVEAAAPPTEAAAGSPLPEPAEPMYAAPPTEAVAGSPLPVPAEPMDEFALELKFPPLEVPNAEDEAPHPASVLADGEWGASSPLRSAQRKVEEVAPPSPQNSVRSCDSEQTPKWPGQIDAEPPADPLSQDSRGSVDDMEMAFQELPPQDEVDWNEDATTHTNMGPH